MYKAAHTGVVKISRLPPGFFDQLFAVQSVQDVQKLVSGNIGLLEGLVADETVPKGTRYFIRDLVAKAKKGKLNETMALKSIPMLYSMSTRAGGNSQIKWTVFSRSKEPGLSFSHPQKVGKYADYALHPRYLQLGAELFDLLESGGGNLLNEMSGKLLKGAIIPWARVDYRTARPIHGKHTFAIIDIGMGTVGTFEKDVIAESQYKIRSDISKKLAESILQYHLDRTRQRPRVVVIALPDDYLTNEGKLARSAHDLEGLRNRFTGALGHENVFILPYSKLRIEDSSAHFSHQGKRAVLGKNDLMLVYNPNKPMERSLERAMQRHMVVVGHREFAAISDKRVNSPFILAARAEAGPGKIIVPKRGPIIKVSSFDEIPERLRQASSKLGNSGVVIKLPMPIETSGKALPSALFFNPNSPFQAEAIRRSLSQHFESGARTFSTEELIRPHAVAGEKGGLELRFYYSGKKQASRRRARRR